MPASSRALQPGRVRRRQDRGQIRRRGRLDRAAGHGVSQPRAARQGRRRARLRVVGQLPGDRAGRRGAAGAHRARRVRHAAHLRGEAAQIRVPHQPARHHGQRGGGQIRARQDEGHVGLFRHQPELRLGPGFLARLQSDDEGAGAEGDHRQGAVSQAVRRRVRRRDFGAVDLEIAGHSFELLRRRPRGLHLPVGGARAAAAHPDRAHHRRDLHVPGGQQAARRHHHRRPRPARADGARQRAEPLAHRRPTPTATAWRRSIRPTTWRSRCSA